MIHLLHLFKNRPKKPNFHVGRLYDGMASGTEDADIACDVRLVALPSKGSGYKILYDNKLYDAIWNETEIRFDFST